MNWLGKSVPKLIVALLQEEATRQPNFKELIAARNAAQIWLARIEERRGAPAPGSKSPAKPPAGERGEHPS
jgi:hypothetical protein